MNNILANVFVTLVTHSPGQNILADQNLPNFCLPNKEMLAIGLVKQTFK